jgi:serine/threonine protein kinase
MLRPDGYVKVLDFGLAKLTTIAPTEATMPVRPDTGVVMGTMPDMSPEQLRGDSVDARTDVFSLGVLLFELVSARRPFESSSPSGVIAAILTDEASFVLDGYIERPHPPGWNEPDVATAEYADWIIARVTDERRALDYLATRPQIDLGKLGFFGPSAGSFLGLVLTAVEPRYRAVILNSAGIFFWEPRVSAAANRINFAPRIHAPKLFIKGRYDENVPLRTHLEPLLRLMTEPKKLVVYEGGHVVPMPLAIREGGAFYDQHLGRVQ